MNSRHFSKDEVQMSNKFMRKWSTSEDIKNANENYTEILNPTPVNMAVTKTITTGGSVYKETCIHRLLECKLVWSLWKSVLRIPE